MSGESRTCPPGEQKEVEQAHDVVLGGMLAPRIAVIARHRTS
ncbi:MAG: hypothetical protein ACM3KD_07220 [Hyphomicrobiaceae bacterium]